MIGWFFDRFFVVLGAFMGSQIPEFMQQYTQRLGGHVDELSHLLKMVKQSAALSNKNMETYIQKFMTQGDPDFVHQGEFMSSLLSRWEQLSNSLARVMESSIWAKPYVFFTNVDGEIFTSTAKSFQSGFALTIEGVVYTAFGAIITLLIYHGVIKIFKMLLTLFKSNNTPSRPNIEKSKDLPI
jgi:hypothetical protein